MATFLDLAVDIYHIFPKAWCAKNGVDATRRESIVNKTALSAKTNRLIGGRPPSDYLAKVEARSGISAGMLDRILAGHLLEPALLRAADFDAFFADRRLRLLDLIGTAMGKPIHGVDRLDDAEPPDQFEDEPEDPTDDVEEDAGHPSADRATATRGRPRQGGGTVRPGHAKGGAGPVPENAGGDLVMVFHDAMLEVYRRAKAEAGYNAGYFHRMVDDQGGLEAARTLLHSAKPSEGFTQLWTRNRLDLTVERVVLEPRFASLFTEDELEIARSRLRHFGYPLDY